MSKLSTVNDASSFNQEELREGTFPALLPEVPGQLEVVPAPGDGVVDGGAGPEGGAVAVIGVGCLIRKAVVSSTTVKSKHGPGI